MEIHLVFQAQVRGKWRRNESLIEGHQHSDWSAKHSNPAFNKGTITGRGGGGTVERRCERNWRRTQKRRQSQSQREKATKKSRNMRETVTAVTKRREAAGGG